VVLVIVVLVLLDINIRKRKESKDLYSRDYIIYPMEKQIIKWLKEFKRLPTSRFVGLLGLDYESVKKLLEELEKEGLLIKEVETTATYWILK